MNLKPPSFSQAFALSFFVFGTINNVLYVVILSAALDLVDKETPKGIILLANILPALMSKLGWPYFVHGEVRYRRRIASCSSLSFLGILVCLWSFPLYPRDPRAYFVGNSQIVAASDGLFLRLLGIGIASFSSGLGEMTYLQLATTYSMEAEDSLGGVAVGWFSSGTVSPPAPDDLGFAASKLTLVSCST